MTSEHLGGIQRLVAEFTVAGADGQQVLEAYLRLAGWAPNSEPGTADITAIAELNAMIEETDGHPSTYRYDLLVRRLKKVVPSKTRGNGRRETPALDETIPDLIAQGGSPWEIAQRVEKSRQHEARTAKQLIDDLSAVREGQQRIHPNPDVPSSFKRKVRL